MNLSIGAGSASTTFVIVLAAYVVAVIACGVVTLLKGKYWFALFGLAAGIFWIVGALRLARPYSWWFNNRYDDQQRGFARARYAAPQIADGTLRIPARREVVDGKLRPAALGPPTHPNDDPSAAPGWYAASDGSPRLERWDGTAWTGSYRRL